MHSTDIATRLTHRLFGAPLLRNSIRGEYVEEMVAVALEPEWTLCAGDWGACDLAQVDGPLRIQVKQSAARQSWHTDTSPPPRPSFSIAHKTGSYEGATWTAGYSRNAEIFIFAWHDRTDPAADHREPDQWHFYVVAEHDLPGQKSLALTTLSKIADPVPFGALKAAVSAVASSLKT